MKISEITTRRLQIDSQTWFANAPRPKEFPPYFEYPLFTFDTDDGIQGHSMGYGPLGAGHGDARRMHDVYYHDLVGANPLHTEAIWQKIRLKNRHLYSMTDTLQGEIDVALWDIKGKASGQSISSLLGQYRDKVPLYRTHPPQLIRTEEQVRSKVRATIKEGYAGMKLQPLGGPALDLPRLRAARIEAGENYPLMVDCSGSLSFVEALELGHSLDELNYTWFEEPIPDRNTYQLKRLADSLRLPVLAAETVSLQELPQYIIEGAVDIARADVRIKGGITGLVKSIHFCELLGVEVEIHTAASPLLDVANLQVACALPGSRFLEAHHDMFRFGLKGNPLAVDADGCQRLPAGPGLGVEIDWDFVDNHTVELINGPSW